ncbi:TetR/AcrR family transcriptional regulator [Mycobacterium sp. PDNC021]|uniref:TetR/AcrR family transcriptional regulator n=1 Tax=Mycobacterium sp. PDNC021 TaxID=3391399 RepID=UPI003AAD3D56
MLEAALDLIAESGVRSVTKRAVCSRARLNDRYFYEHFSDINALLLALGEWVTTQGLQAVLDATRGSAPPARVHAAAGAALGFLLADPRRAQLLISSHTTETLQSIRIATNHQIAASMSALTREQLGPKAPPTCDTDLVSFTIISGTMELVAAWLRGEFDTDRDHLTDIIAAMLFAAGHISRK